MTLAEIQAQKAAWMAASLVVATKQNYAINGRTLTFANAAEIREQISYWSGLETAKLREADGQSSISIKVAKFS